MEGPVEEYNFNLGEKFEGIDNYQILTSLPQSGPDLAQQAPHNLGGRIKARFATGSYNFMVEGSTIVQKTSHQTAWFAMPMLKQRSIC